MVSTSLPHSFILPFVFFTRSAAQKLKDQLKQKSELANAELAKQEASVVRMLRDTFMHSPPHSAKSAFRVQTSKCASYHHGCKCTSWWQRNAASTSREGQDQCGCKLEWGSATKCSLCRGTTLNSWSCASVSPAFGCWVYVYWVGQVQSCYLV